MGRDRRSEVAERAADVALAARPVPLRVLDVGCGAGDLLAELVARAPYCEAYVGVDRAETAASAAQQTTDRRIGFICASPEALPFPTASFDLVVASDSFDAWPDQARGVAELSRVLQPAGTIVIVDRTRRQAEGASDRAHSTKALTALLEPAGLRLIGREALLRNAFAAAAVQAVVAGR